MVHRSACTAQTPEQATAPDALIKMVVSDVMASVKSDPDIQKGNIPKIVDLVEKKIVPYTDMRRTTEMAMGPNWKKATAEQQNQLVLEFKNLLIRTYSGALSQLRDQTVQFKALRAAPDDKEVVVKTVVLGRGDPVPLDYRLEKTDKGWKVYDMNIMGVWLIEAYRNLLTSPELDPAFKELALTLPAEAYLYEQCVSVDPQKIYSARRAFRHAIASELRIEWAALYQQMQSAEPFSPDAASAGKRGLKNLALSMLLDADPLIWAPMAVNQYQNADNMTDRYAALAGLVIHGSKSASACLEDFYQRFADDALVIDKWFALQSSRPPVPGAESTLQEVKRLREHDAFRLNNPNRVRSVIHAFCMNNPASFHQADGSGYEFWAESVLTLDSINPQVASRLARGLDRWRHFAQPYRDLMLAALKQVAACQTLSADVKEVVSKALANESQ